MTKHELIKSNVIENRIYTIRGFQVMIDSDLAELYQVEVKVLNQAVKRKQERFPREFMFQLSEEEHYALRCQNGASNTINSLRSQIVTSKNRGGRRFLLKIVMTDLSASMILGW